MRKLTFMSIALLLSACGTTSAVRDRVVVEKVPVAVQPITAAQVPTPPAPLPQRPRSLSAAADVLLAEHCQWVAFAIVAMPLLEVSAGVPVTQLPRYPECEGK